MPYEQPDKVHPFFIHTKDGEPYDMRRGFNMTFIWRMKHVVFTLPEKINGSNSLFNPQDTTPARDRFTYNGPKYELVRMLEVLTGTKVVGGEAGFRMDTIRFRPPQDD